MKAPYRKYLFIACMPLMAMANAQGGCPNVGFETGTFEGWSGRIGFCCPISMSGTGIFEGRHTVMSGTGRDPNTNNVVPVVAPGGGTHSVRLGNDDADSQAEQLSYTMTVDDQNALFVYRYAVVFQDPFHSPGDQPRFEIRMFDGTGVLIDCGIYNVYSSAGIEGFVSTIDAEGEVVRYKDWTTVGMDLSGFIGQSVTIEFSTGDCALGAHYGYAYIDCQCAPLVLSAEFCPGEQSTTLEAPLGFASYLWSTGETTPSITIGTPVEGQVYSCTLTSVTGCAFTLTTSLEPSVVQAEIVASGSCTNDVVFTNNSVVLAGSALSSWLWDFGDGTTSTEEFPDHEFADPGQHSISLTVGSPSGCTDQASVTIDVLAAPFASFSVEGTCEGDTFQFMDASTLSSGLATRTWSFGDGAVAQEFMSTSHLYATAGAFTPSLVIVDLNGCSDTATTSLIVTPLPATDLGPDRTICPSQVIVLDPGVADSYSWSNGANTPTISVNDAGLYWVIATLDGCSHSDTLVVSILTDPGSLELTTQLCPNEGYRLTIPISNGSYLWDTGETTRSILATGSGTHTFSAIDGNGCSFNGTITGVLDPLDLGVTAPNVITPNGDGLNDRFEPDANGSKAVEVTIFGRFGNPVFQSPTLDKLWNGRSNSEPVPDGTYFYVLKYQPQCSEAPIELHGTVTVLR